MIRHFITIAFLTFATSVHAETDTSSWTNVTIMGSAGRAAYFVEVQPRVGNDVSSLQQVLFRGAIGTALSSKATVYGGYSHILNSRENAPGSNEERLFGQLSWTVGRIGAGTLSSRTRLEHRRVSTGQDTGWRLREMVRYVHPIATGRSPRALVWAEPFVAFNDTDWGARKGFDQLRSFAGLEISLPGKSTLEAGYMNQRTNLTGGRIRSNHIASLTFFIRP
jgi:hypothetical protein